VGGLLARGSYSERRDECAPIARQTPALIMQAKQPVSPPRIPKGFRNKAQSCEARVTHEPSVCSPGFSPPDVVGPAKAGTTNRGCMGSRTRGSADFQSAVSPISNRQGVGGAGRVRSALDPQAGSTAIQLIGNLRYGSAGELALPAQTPGHVPRNFHPSLS
jgi:hypothetical protein